MITPPPDLPPDPSACSRALATLWNEVAPVGRNPDTGGYRRFAWTAEDLTLREWFAGAARARGLDVDPRPGRQPVGLVGRPGPGGHGRAPGLVLGSHLDSVPDGGPYDGPLGVVSALAAVEVLRAQGFEPDRPIAVVNFADEEGARYRHRLRRLAADHRGPRRRPGPRPARRRRAGPWPRAMAAAGLDARARSVRTRWPLQRIGTFVELHVEQGRGLVDLGAAGRGGRLDLAARALALRLRR